MIAVQHIHTIFVHFPIVLIFIISVLDIICFWRDRDVTIRSGTGTISSFLALASGVFAVATWHLGGLALDVAKAGGFSSEVAEMHEGLGGLTALTFLIWGVIRLTLWIRSNPSDRNCRAQFGSLLGLRAHCSMRPALTDLCQADRRSLNAPRWICAAAVEARRIAKRVKSRPELCA